MTEPELGQLFAGYYNGFETPGYVTTGIDSIDALIGEHIFAAGERQSYVNGESWSTWEPITGNTGNEFVVEGAPFEMRAYSWSEGDERPNFHHFTSDFQAYWYKHSHRGESCNQEISRKDWQAIQRECEDWVTAQPKGFRVLITGSREWASELYEPIPGKRWKRIRENWKSIQSHDLTVMMAALRDARERANGAHLRIVEGAANGADQVAGLLGEWAENASVETHPALWDRKPDGSYNRLAGFQRNQRMVDQGADICLAFLKRSAANKGTLDCIARAKSKGIEVVEVWDRD